MWPTRDQNNPDQRRISSPGRQHRLTLSTRHEPNGRVTVRVAGEVDLSTTVMLRARLDEVLQGRDSTVVIDLSGVEFLGVAGLRELLATRSEAVARGVELRLAACSHPVRRALEVTGLVEMFPGYPEPVDPVAADVVQQRTPSPRPRTTPSSYSRPLAAPSLWHDATPPSHREVLSMAPTPRE